MIRPSTIERPVLDTIARGAFRYTLCCTALDVGGGDRVILADHRILPLSWTRDAYYQAQLLLAAAHWDARAVPTVAGHLRWLWGRAREHGVWMRSHRPDGRPKDLRVAADQQIYPMLELADYRRIVGAWPTPPSASRPDGATSGEDRGLVWGALVAQAWRSLPLRGPDRLLATEENPADDPTDLPYLVSTQVLLWHAALSLAPWSAELGIEGLQLAEVADSIRLGVHRDFVCDGPTGPMWAYEIDDARGHRLYQDANDLPTAFAPLLGFCAPDDPVWLATMRFALSSDNPGYVAGPYGGLGSAHTPGTWTLGDAQELAFGAATGALDRIESVVDRLARVAGPDGLLPETYDPQTCEWTARHWFAWPSAVIGSLHLGAVVPARVGAATNAPPPD